VACGSYVGPTQDLTAVKRFSSFERGVVLRNPHLDQLVKFGSLFQNLFGLGFGRNVGVRIIDHVAFSPASLEVVGILAGSGAQREPDGLKRDLVMPRLDGDAVSSW
jgi:hypothetical protein